jgi:hypothetical protein
VKPSLSTGAANLSSALKEGLCFKETAQPPRYKCGDKIQTVIMTRLTKHQTVCTCNRYIVSRYCSSNLK